MRSVFRARDSKVLGKGEVQGLREKSLQMAHIYLRMAPWQKSCTKTFSLNALSLTFLGLDMITLICMMELLRLIVTD